MKRRTLLGLGNPPTIKSLAGLEAYNQPLSRADATHLLRRMTIAFTKAEVDILVGQNALQAVNSLIDGAKALPLPEAPTWANEGYPATWATQAVIDTFNSNNSAWRLAYRQQTLGAFMQNGFLEKMLLFWHNHFVTELVDYTYATFTYRYATLIRTYALGNFKDFTSAMGINIAMLTYLNGNQNTRTAPNENYARELLELFTIGIGNYTQEDVKEMARALTGWQRSTTTLTTYFTASRSDSGNKTIFGQVGNWAYNDAINLIFNHKTTETATFICRKLYRFFVYAEPDETIVQQLAVLLVQNNFNVEPVLRTLLSSAHFFDAAFHGTRIKSPFEMLLGLIKALNTTNTEATLLKFANEETLKMGQYIWDPPNVAGWGEHQEWLNATLLSARWNAITKLINGTTSGTRMAVYNPVPFAKTFPLPQNVYELAYDLAQFFSPVPVEISQKTALGDRLLAGIPYYEWDVESVGAPVKLRNYLIYLLKLPEFQLA